MKNLNQALLCFQSKNVAVMKNARAAINDRAGYKYADLPQVMDAVLPALTECGLLLKQRICLDKETKITLLTTTIVHSETDESESLELPCFVDEKPQSFGSRLTYLRRYSILTILNLAPDDDDDAIAANQDVASREQARQYRERSEREAESRRQAPAPPPKQQPPRQQPPQQPQQPPRQDDRRPPQQERSTRDHQQQDLGDCPECGDRLMASKFPHKVTGQYPPYCRSCRTTVDFNQQPSEQYHGSY